MRIKAAPASTDTTNLHSRPHPRMRMQPLGPRRCRCSWNRHIIMNWTCRFHPILFSPRHLGWSSSLTERSNQVLRWFNTQSSRWREESLRLQLWLHRGVNYHQVTNSPALKRFRADLFPLQNRSVYLIVLTDLYLSDRSVDALHSSWTSGRRRFRPFVTIWSMAIRI